MATNCFESKSGFEWLLLAIRDITERKRFQRALQEKNIELENASRAKDRFLASMSHEDQEKLFGAFSQVDASNRSRHEGTGLGLHLSRRLAELLGGEITFQSGYAKGSVFTLTLTQR